MKNYSLYLFILVAFLSLGCKDKTEKGEDDVIDKAALIIGTWKLIETTDPEGMPAELLYIFKEDKTFTYRITVQQGSRSNSTLEGTWRFVDAEQTQVEITLITPLAHIVEVLDETTLRLSAEGVTEVFVRQ